MHREGDRAPSAVPGVAGWAKAALAELATLPDVHRVGLALDEGGGRRLLFTASDRDGGAESPWCHIDAYDDLPINTAARTGELVAGSLDELRGRYAEFVDRQADGPTAAVAAVPLLVAGRGLGGFVLFFDAPQSFGLEHRLALARRGAELGAALHLAQLGERRAVAETADEGAPPGAVVAVHDVAPTPEAVGEARHVVRDVLVDWGVGPDLTDTAVLCVSELVTNAVIHAHNSCTLRLLLEGDVLTATVRDGGSRGVTTVGQIDDHLQVHGRGLEVVERLASRWGYDLDAHGTRVWFVLDL
ncbi:ATP-binding protein [Nocardioides cynanchi]|uniref:ATP-binding protein n=1 Tax=Nocardioides cynanchi TaxID=2558918 RepID=UPI00124717A9|nr:ATP-binding protein [Nocardioides cynanchi]